MGDWGAALAFGLWGLFNYLLSGVLMYRKENRRWARSLGYSDPETAWREVNRKRSEERLALLAEVRRVVEEVLLKQHYIGTSTEVDTTPLCDEILSRLDKL